MTTLATADLAILDTETTGLGPAAAVVEIAVVHASYRDLPRVAFHARVNPGKPIEAGAAAAHGITDADVVDAPSFGAIADDVLAAIRGRVVIAYNAPFDYGRLRWEFDRLGRDTEPLSWPWVDLLVWRKVRPKGVYGGNKLSEVLEELGIALDAHGAAGDAMATALALPSIAAAVHTTFAHTELVRLLARQAEHALEQEVGFCTWARSKGKRERPDCPWHELLEVPPPAWPERPKPFGRCPRCRGEARLAIAKDGTLAIYALDGEAHRCGG